MSFGVVVLRRCQRRGLHIPRLRGGDKDATADNYGFPGACDPTPRCLGDLPSGELQAIFLMLPTALGRSPVFPTNGDNSRAAAASSPKEGGWCFPGKSTGSDLLLPATLRPSQPRPAGDAARERELHLAPQTHEGFGRSRVRQDPNRPQTTCRSRRNGARIERIKMGSPPAQLALNRVVFHPTIASRT